jgi:pimeloyl-ACP methyl ester carboxylesterase
MSALAIVVLHGANGSAKEMEPLSAPLRPYGRVIAHDLPGHGGRELPDRLSIPGAAQDVIARLDREGIERAFVVGYSLGGYEALYLARHFPQRILGACAIATKFFFDAETVKYWTYLAQPERLDRPGNPRAAEMLAAHGPYWKAVTIANCALFGDLGASPPLTEDDLRAIERPVMLVNSNRDALIQWDETLALGKLIPGARLAMFYGLAHPLRNVPVTRIGEAIGQWLREVVPA